MSWQVKLGLCGTIVCAVMLCALSDALWSCGSQGAVRRQVAWKPPVRLEAFAMRPQPSGSTPETDVLFSRDVAPILAQHCSACHNVDVPEGGFRVDSFEQLMASGDSGVAIDPEAPSESELLVRLETDDTSLRMPLDGEPLPPEQLELVRTWLQQGARFDGSDPAMKLALLLPPPTYEAPPQTYPFPVAITALAFSADGSQLFVGGYHEVLQWDWQAQEIVRRISNAPERITSIAVDDAQQRLYVAGGQPGERGEVRCFDLSTGKLIDVPFVGSDVVWSIELSPNAKQLAIGGADRQLVVVDLDERSVVQRLAVHSDWVFDVAWDPQGKRIASASRDQSAKVFEVATGELLANYPKHECEVRGVTFFVRAAAGEQLAVEDILSTDVHGIVDRWHADDANRVKRKELSDHPLFPAWVTTEGCLIIDTRGELWRSDASFELVERRLESLAQSVTSAAFDAGHRQVACGLSDGTVVIRALDDSAATVRWRALPMEVDETSVESAR